MITETPPRSGRGAAKTPQEVLASGEFHRLVARRWKTSIVLTALLFVLYYGYVLLIAMDKTFLARRIGEATTLGIPIGVLVIIGAWVLTGAYVRWANRSHDSEVQRLREEMGR